jgi:hypothetical protein
LTNSKAKEAFSKYGRILKKQPNIAAFAYSFIETGGASDRRNRTTDR